MGTRRNKENKEHLKQETMMHGKNYTWEKRKRTINNVNQSTHQDIYW